MSTPAAASPTDRDDAPSLPEGVFEEALDGPADPRRNSAMLQLVRHVVPYAMSLIRAALDESGLRRTTAPTTGWPCGGRGVIDGPLTEKCLPTKSM